MRVGSASLGSGLSSGAGQVLRASYPVTVQGGRLSLRLADQGGASPYFALDALDIAPASATSATPVAQATASQVVAAQATTAVTVDASWLSARGAGPWGAARSWPGR